ncbi:conserved hypothetical protein [Verrucomicrobia bacterium]|nr:conserved hypothetical protein [Verrucomicrobiota bacterium]
MKFSEGSLTTIFAKNRTEELGMDVWLHFVVPLFFDKLDLGAARKPRLFVGGRGCGKTMLLRYLSHQSAFSLHRETIPDTAIEHIGLYWRVDTQFAVIMNERGLPGDTWHSAFNHFLALVLGFEILQSLKNVANSKFALLTMTELDKAKFDRFSVFDPSFSGGLDNFALALETKLWEFESWVANVRKCKEPIFLPGGQFLSAVIAHIRSAFQGLKRAQYFVYVDEFENLLAYQQRILNTYVKHSESPLIFNLAMKRHAFETVHTVGTESIQGIADFRTHDLDAYLLENNFPLFAAEVLFLNLSLAGDEDIPFDIRALRDPDQIRLREAEPHQLGVLRKIREMLPGLSHDELATHVFANPALSRKLLERVDIAMKVRGTKLPTNRFYRPGQPQATIIIPALLYRKRLTPEEIAQEFDLLETNKESKFAGDGGWIRNNFIGCLLWLYESHSSACPFYAGFDTFCLLAHGNLRHFLELCHVSLAQRYREVRGSPLSVPAELQAKAARQTSTAFLNEIPAFGALGDRLHTFVFRLGSLLALAHRRPTQSEPEQSHFAITSGSTPLTEETKRFLREAEKWSVLFEFEETKLKNDHQPVSFEYVLNPIYSPYFHITYRKKRKLGLSGEELQTLIHGSFDDANKLLKRFSKLWEIDEDPRLTPFLRFADEERQ